jgi:hypothetical protein
MSDKKTTMLKFSIYRGDSLIQRIESDRPSVKIGRGSDADLVVDDSSVSELHAVVNVQDSGNVSVFDLGGEGGTRVRGETISNAPLKSGDAFDIGALRVVVEYAVVVAPPADDVVGEAIDPMDAVDDVITILTRPAPAEPGAKGRPKVLEVNQVWGEALLASRQFAAGTSVTIGAGQEYVWRVAGRKVGAVQEPMNKLVVFAPPGLASCVNEFASDFFIPSESISGAKDYAIARPKGSGWVVDAAKNWGGFVQAGDVRMTFEQAVAANKATRTSNGFEIPVDDETRVAVDVDGRLFLFRTVPSGVAIPFIASLSSQLSSAVTSPAFVLGIIAFFFSLLIGVLVARTPYVARNEITEIDQRYVELLMEKPPPPEKKKGGNPDAGEGAKAKGEEGKVGKKDAKMEKAKGDKVKMQKQEIDRQVVERAGVMGALSDDSLSQTLGASGLSSDIQGGIGGLIGAKGTQIGSGGLGGRGSGIGGGGTAEGLGGLGTKGVGSGASGYGSGGGSLGSKGEGGIGSVGGDPIIMGALDRSLIDEVIKRHMNQIRYCYQRELVKNNGLAGKIVIKFTISKDGSVASASTKSTTMNNQAVESCIEGRFMKMQFPQPKGGGIVLVSYPFMFSPG